MEAGDGGVEALAAPSRWPAPNRRRPPVGGRRGEAEGRRDAIRRRCSL